MQFKTWQELFKATDRNGFISVGWHEIQVEELYQHITARWEEEAFDRVYAKVKARLMDEVVAYGYHDYKEVHYPLKNKEG